MGIPRRRTTALRGSLASVALLAFVGCSREPAAADPEMWAGTYSGTKYATHSIELLPDGTYRSLIWQGFITASGCGGPFVGDGASEGRWSTGARHVTFEVEKETGGLAAPLEGARLLYEDGGFVLRPADGRGLAMVWGQR